MGRMVIPLRYGLVLAVAVSSAESRNLLTNPEFTTNVDGWVSPGSSIVLLHRADAGSTLPGGSGPGSLEVQLFLWGGGSTGALQEVAITAGTTYRLELSYYHPATADNVADHVVGAIFWDDAGGDSLDWAYVRPDPLVTGEWRRIEVESTAPTGAVSAEVRLMVGTPNLSGETRPGVAYFDDAAFAPIDGGLEVVDIAFLPGAASTAGLAGTFWTTQLMASSLADVEVELRAAMLRPDVDNTAAVGSPAVLGTLPPRGHLAVDDVVGVLGEGGTGGLVIVAVADGAAAQLPLVRVASRTSTPNQLGSGSYGQGIRVVRGEDRRDRCAPGARVDAGFRTNAGALNLSPAPLTLTVAVLAEGGAELVRETWNLPPFAHHQRSLAAMGTGVLGGGTVTFGNAGDLAPYAAYVSVIDEETGDPTYIEAE